MEFSCINQNIESQPACFSVVYNHTIYSYLINLFCVKIKQNIVVFHVYKAVIACQTHLQYAIGKATG